MSAKYELSVQVDQTGNIYAQSIVLGTYDTLQEASDALDAAVIPGVRGPGCMAVRRVIEKPDDYILSRDGKPLFRGSEAACMAKLHSLCPASIDHATKHEGYAIEEATP